MTKEDFGQKQLEVLRSLDRVVLENLILLPIDKAWQPADFLPDLSGDDWMEQVTRFREPSKSLDDELLVVLVADMITEEALPSYSVALNLLAEDETGTEATGWARWLRGWTSEENRHGDLLNAYLRLTGRVNMRSVEVTIHHLLTTGFNPRAYPDPYGGLVYTAFQERATKISHANVARRSMALGDTNLNRICLKIAGDESRHESFYTKMMSCVMDEDPSGGILVFNRLMRQIIDMPGRLMFDGKDPDLFEHFAVVAQRTGIYTVRDYIDIARHLLATWGIADRKVSGEAARAQEYLCKLPAKYECLAERFEEVTRTSGSHPFSWINGRSV